MSKPTFIQINDKTLLNLSMVKTIIRSGSDLILVVHDNGGIQNFVISGGEPKFNVLLDQLGI